MTLYLYKVINRWFFKLQIFPKSRNIGEKLKLLLNILTKASITKYDENDHFLVKRSLLANIQLYHDLRILFFRIFCQIFPKLFRHISSKIEVLAQIVYSIVNSECNLA